MLELDSIRIVLYNHLNSNTKLKDFGLGEIPMTDDLFFYANFEDHEDFYVQIPNINSIEELIDFLTLYKMNLDSTLAAILSAAIEELKQKESQLEFPDNQFVL